MSPCAVIEVSGLSYVLEFFTVVSCNVQFYFIESAYERLEQNNFKHESLEQIIFNQFALLITVIANALMCKSESSSFVQNVCTRS